MNWLTSAKKRSKRRKKDDVGITDVVKLSVTLTSAPCSTLETESGTFKSQDLRLLEYSNINNYNKLTEEKDSLETIPIYKSAVYNNTQTTSQEHILESLDHSPAKRLEELISHD